MRSLASNYRAQSPRGSSADHGAACDQRRTSNTVIQYVSSTWWLLSDFFYTDLHLLQRSKPQVRRHEWIRRTDPQLLVLHGVRLTVGLSIALTSSLWLPKTAEISKLAAVVWNDSTVVGAAALAPWSLVPSKTPAAKGLVQVLLYLAPVH